MDPETRPAARLLRISEVAGLLATSTRQVFKWIEAGRLTAVKLSSRCTRVAEAEVERFVAEATKGEAK